MDYRSSDSLIYAFPDANVFMHFTMFTAVEWPKLLGSDEVCLVLAPSVVRELEKFKDDSSQQARRDRVRNVLSKLKPLLRASTADNPAKVGLGTSIFDIAWEPIIDWQEHGLDPNIGDDRLLATISMFELAVSGQVLLITNDFLLERKAATRKIQSWDPEGKINPVEQSSPVEKENRQLKERLRVMENRTPKVSLGFWENTKLIERVSRSLYKQRLADNGEVTITAYIEHLRSVLDERVSNIDSRVTSKRIADYRHEYEQYLRELHSHLFKSHAYKNGHRFQFDFVFSNDGSAPISDVEIKLDFPTGSFVVSVDEEEDDYYGLGDLNEPPKPAIPEPPQTYYPGIDPSILGMAHLPTVFPRPVPAAVPRGPLYDLADRSYIEYETPKLRHKEKWLMHSVIAYVLVDQPGGFSINYIVRADNLVEPIEGKLHVVLKAAVS